MDHFRPHLHHHGVTEQQWRVLRALAEYGPLDASTLARRVCLLMPSLSRILRDLALAKLLKRTRKEGDGRMVIVSLTPSGRGLFQRMSRESEQIYASLAAAIGRDRLDAMGADLEALIAALQEEPTHFQAKEKDKVSQDAETLSDVLAWRISRRKNGGRGFSWPLAIVCSTIWVGSR